MSGKLTKDQQARLIEKIAPLRERGMGCSGIADRVEVDGIKISAGAINYYLAKEGIAPRRGKTRMRAAKPYTNSRGILVRQFTPEDDVKLLKLRSAGRSISEICAAMGRKPNSVKHRLFTLALIEECAIEDESRRAEQPHAH